MSEKFPTAQPSKQKEKFLTQEEMEKEADHETIDFYKNDIIQDSPEKCAEKVRVFESLITYFEQTYDLAALRSVTHFNSREEREMHPVRQPALDVMTALTQLFTYLKSQDAISKEDVEVWREKLVILNNAIGFIQGDPAGKVFDVVSHERRPL